MKDIIIKNPQAFGYTLLGIVPLTDANYSTKTFNLTNHYKYVVIKPVNPLAAPVKIDTFGVNGQCIWNTGDFNFISDGEIHNSMYMYVWTWPGPTTCPDGKYLEMSGNSGILGMRSYGTTPWNQITIYGVK